jgi:hypothetical protein
VVNERCSSCCSGWHRSCFNAANPKLYGKSTVINNLTNEPLKTTSYRQAKEQEIINKQGKPKRGVSVKGEGKNAYYEKRNFQPGHVAALAIPTGIAINTGLGLMTPFGGAEGYKAAIPSEDDPTKTANVVGEVGLKYFMGRTGQLLPYDEFVKVRTGCKSLKNTASIRPLSTTRRKTGIH